MQNRAKINQKSVKNRSWGVLGRLGTEKGKRKGTPRVPVRHLGASWRLLGPSWSEKGNQHGSNLAHKTEPKSIKNRGQHRSILNAFRDPIFEGFWWIWDVKWSQVGTQMASKIDGNFERRFKKKRRFLGKTMILKVLEVEVGTKHRLKIDQKMKASWEGLLASIFHGFSSILEAKMDPSWRENQ